MKKIVLVSALVSATMLSAPAAFAFGPFGPPYGPPNTPPPPPPPTVDLPSCDTLCDPLRDDIRQKLEGFQKAINMIVDVDDATDIVQTAVNAGNLVNLDSVVFTLGTVDQYADVSQFAFNLIDGGKGSTFQNLEQAATNVVNSITGTTAWNIKQEVKNHQVALNTILGGSGGYDADLDGALEDAMTQSAVNASNLVDIDKLKNDIVQTSTNSQTAINTAVFQSQPIYYGYYPVGYIDADVWDLGQSATNVTNNVSVGDIDLSGACACDFEVSQYADAGQLAKNYLSTFGDVNNIIQSATNVANSISLPSTNGD